MGGGIPLPRGGGLFWDSGVLKPGFGALYKV